MNILSEIWSAPNTFVSWLVTRFYNNGSYKTLDGITVYISDGLFTNFCLGKYAVAQLEKAGHEITHGRISKCLGWGYLIHLWYLLYSVIILFFENGSITGWNLLGSGVFFILWFMFNEWLVKKWK